MIEIIKWSETFEDAYSRKLQILKRFNHPPGCQSKGYRRLAREGKEGLLAFGLFGALAQLMATMSKEIRAEGIFRNGDGSLMELDDIIDLCRLDGMKVGEVWEALGRLVACGWVKIHKSLENGDNATSLPHPSHPSPTSIPVLGKTTTTTTTTTTTPTTTPTPSDSVPLRVTEEVSDPSKNLSTTSEEKTTGEVSYPPIVEELWSLTPSNGRNRSSRAKLAKAWRNIRPRPKSENVVEGLKAWCLSDQWKRGFVPGIHTWLSDRKWENPPEPEGRPSIPSPSIPTSETDSRYEHITE